jgi:hypothetical protein
MANPPVRLRVLLAAVDEAAGDALCAEIQGTPHVRVVGGVWQADKVAEGVAAFDAQVVLLPASFPELPMWLYRSCAIRRRRTPTRC